MLQRFYDVNLKFGMTSPVFNIPELSQQSFAIDFYEKSSLKFAFGLAMQFLIQGDSDITFFTLNSNRVYVAIGINRVLKGRNFRILTLALCLWN
jgi:hypothetical protein